MNYGQKPRSKFLSKKTKRKKNRNHDLALTIMSNIVVVQFFSININRYKKFGFVIDIIGNVCCIGFIAI